ncbi:hypothetical protein F4820DRAFT_435975 [Hypoxylon rubiginosum]|uniref:Uncharacterized protein n=1 Tax=Hypoxylon rubiginosum TaxID=110542 RepID=A0ACB9YNM8_9PEZI|nr:hypothetical protein F4820DRAFT_435975 [Hypoxylon rubiginosum]
MAASCEGQLSKQYRASPTCHVLDPALHICISAVCMYQQPIMTHHGRTDLVGKTEIRPGFEAPDEGISWAHIVAETWAHPPTHPLAGTW